MGNSKEAATQQLTLRQSLLQKLVVVLVFAPFGIALAYYHEYVGRVRGEREVNRIISELQSGKKLHEINLKAD